MANQAELWKEVAATKQKQNKPSRWWLDGKKTNVHGKPAERERPNLYIKVQNFQKV
jgi:hypothetical protein